MTKEEALNYVKLHAAKEGLEHECVTTFNKFNLMDEKRTGTQLEDYWPNANAALYEWDV